MISSEGLRPASNGRKPLGKLASRLEEVKSPWRQVSTLELSHSEAARLATDALLEHGEKEYRRVLAEERELSFLSPLEIRYISQHGAKSGEADGNGTGAAERDFGDGDAVSELTSGTYFPMMSDEEPPMLELGWPEAPVRYGPSETQIYFQRDKSHNVKDLIRSLINKAKKVIALVMDVFTDVDLMCDLMEASNKRKVPVYILLDEKNLSYFTDMCSALSIQNSHLSNMRIRSVSGDTYCTKSGKKFSGQVQEKFMIIDCEEVIAGSYSFTWLSAQVHSNMVMHFSGRITDSFDREFRCLYADSQIIECFFNPDEEGMPYYPAYQAMMGPGMGLNMGLGPVLGLDLLSDRQRDRVCSENSSSQSSNSVSSVKAAPGMSSNTVYKVTQGLDKKEPNNNSNSHLSPERRGGAIERGGGQTPTPQTQITPGPRVNNHSPVPDRPSQTYGQPMGIEWNKPSAMDVMRSNIGGTASKFQALGLYDHKPSMFHTSGFVPGAPNSNLNPKPQIPSPINESKLNSKQRTTSNQFLNKLSDLFLPPSKDKDTYNFRRSPSPHGTSPWGGPDLSQAEPESQQSPPPPPSPVTLMNRQDQKRMTLGHSKLDLVNQYNKMKSKQVYSRFELKSTN
ncbi:protein FAM83C-like isoform X2 [Sphaeramia orbicularis]|uniref:protein FAM83C-like isoform X2 n=1 Tax=Sphaeramia orbicularis TaxID=375764 RepID=UPI00117CF22B|nr:protein FAM83C-like isoform X2 [Sphaeramia orbicularis]